MRPNLLLPAQTRDQIVAFLQSIFVPAHTGKGVMEVVAALSALAQEPSPEDTETIETNE